MFQTSDFVLHMQLATLQRDYLEIVNRQMVAGFLELVLEGLMLFNKILKMRLDGHFSCLLSQISA